jgi:hypothetical protein
MKQLRFKVTAEEFTVKVGPVVFTPQTLVTLTKPVVDPAGTVVAITVSPEMVKEVVVPLPICTCVAEDNLVPRITIGVPTVPFEGVTEVITGTPATTVLVIAFEVAVVGLAQVALLVNTQVTACPVAKVVVANEALLVPAFTPFTFH